MAHVTYLTSQYMSSCSTDAQMHLETLGQIHPWHKCMQLPLISVENCAYLYQRLIWYILFEGKKAIFGEKTRHLISPHILGPNSIVSKSSVTLFKSVGG